MNAWKFALFTVATLLGTDLQASYAIYVGKDLTEDGSVLIGGSGDEVSSHWLEIVPARDHPPRCDDNRRRPTKRLSCRASSSRFRRFGGPSAT